MLRLAVSQDTRSCYLANHARATKRPRHEMDGLIMQLNEARLKLYGLQAGVHQWHEAPGTWLQCYHPLCVEARAAYLERV